MSKNIIGEQCLICGAEALLKTAEQKGYQAPTKYNIYHCASCNTSFALPRINTDSLYQIIYENREKVPGYDRYWKYYHTIKNMDSPIDYLANTESAYLGLVYTLKYILKISKESNILEIGSGLGYTIYALRKDGYVNAYGLDISQKAIEEANRYFGDYYICSDARTYVKDFGGNKYDFIYLTEVIEHIENPVEFISDILPLLNKGGCIVMTTPDKSIYPDNMVWVSDKPPVHYWWFSDNSFRKIAERLDLEVSFLNWSKYYSNHKRELINMKSVELFTNTHVFDEDNRLIEHKQMNFDKKLKSLRIFPDWVKQTYLYRKITLSSIRFFQNQLRESAGQNLQPCVLFFKRNKYVFKNLSSE
jgi:2-polyprenyl-3-methyl-5-hydroxy-6-metoxy-1,4-benzoquinol methylase